MRCEIMVMPVHGPAHRETIVWDADLTFDQQLAPYLAGWSEHVFVKFAGRTCDLFVDESGAMKGLGPNPHATHFLYPGIIYGPAVLFTDRRVWQ